MSIKSKISEILPQIVKDYVHHGIYILKYSKSHIKILHEITEANHVRVAFIVASLAMWKSQNLFDLLRKDKRFEVKIVLSPFVGYSLDSQEAELKKLREFFSNNNCPFEDFSYNHLPYDLRNSFNPHIIFYMQSYGTEHCMEHASISFKDRLQAYIPYSFWPGAQAFGFDLPFHREAWRIYYANELLYKVAKGFSLVNAKNGRIVGYPSSDVFINVQHQDVWKIKDRKVKRIIWAPHFTIVKATSPCSHSSFLDLCDDMPELADRFSKQIQIAFKPHPRLKSELYKIWGKKKTDAYYNWWNSMPNTQLETGEYADLFMTSDALIHECGSFMVEYHYSQQPCLYVMKGFSQFYAEMNELGKKALDLHYQGETIDDVDYFIQKVVLEGKDPFKADRKVFFKEQLLPPNGGSVADNIHKELVKSLKLK